MTPAAESAIREAVKLLHLSRRNFKSRQVEQARELLERVLADLPPTEPNTTASRTSPS
ncbi:MAG: hypothetical protein H8K07_01435 [Nitrospira sp.]|nr:hypothetical protein [Nitrospira sp.]